MKVLVVFYFILGVVAGPFAQKQEVLRGKHASCASIEDYTVQWFIDKAPRERRPAPATCLFYTYKLTGKARWYARVTGMTTIWDVWPGGYYNNDSQSKSNPLRKIMQNKEDRRRYFSNMSIAFASLCDVYAMVMDANVTPTCIACDVVNKLGIWFNDEFPALQRGNKVDNKNNVVYQIQAISPTGGAPVDYWAKGKKTCTHQETETGSKGGLKARDMVLDKGNGEWWDEDVPADINVDDYGHEDLASNVVCEL